MHRLCESDQPFGMLEEVGYAVKLSFSGVAGCIVEGATHLLTRFRMLSATNRKTVCLACVPELFPTRDGTKRLLSCSCAALSHSDSCVSHDVV